MSGPVANALQILGRLSVFSKLEQVAQLRGKHVDEILALAHRVAVLYEGAIVGELDALSATPKQIGLLMAGGTAA